MGERAPAAAAAACGTLRLLAWTLRAASERACDLMYVSPAERAMPESLLHAERMRGGGGASNTRVTSTCSPVAAGMRDARVHAQLAAAAQCTLRLPPHRGAGCPAAACQAAPHACALPAAA